MSAAPADAEAVGQYTHQLRHVARGGAINLVGAAVASLGGFALVALVAAQFDAHVAGQYFSLTSVFLILLALSALGTDTGLARFVPRYGAEDRPEAIAATIRVARVPVLWASLAVAVVVTATADVLAPALGLDGSRGATALRLVALLAPVATLSDFVLAATRGFGQMRPTVVADRITRTLLQPLGAVAVAVLAGGLVALAWSWALPYAVSGALGTLALVRVLRHRDVPRHVDPAVLTEVRREFWAFTWPRSISRVCQIALQRVDIVVVAALLSPTHAAAYTVATRFVPVGQIGGAAIQQALQPRIAHMLALHQHDDAERVFRTATAWSVLTTWPVYCGVAVASAVYLSVFGDEYVTTQAVTTVVVMAVAMMGAVAAGALDTMLLMAGRSTTSLVNAGSALVVDVVLCLLLVPVWGITGAAAAWAASVALRNALGFVQVRRALGMTPGSAQLLRAAGANVACFVVPGLVAVLVGAHALVLLSVLALGGVAYLLLLRHWRRELSLDLVLHALRRRPAVVAADTVADAPEVATASSGRKP